MLKVAITGNIGSGKSTASQVFKTLGISIFNADIEARKLYENEEVKKVLQEKFGKQVLNDQNDVDKKVLADIIFNDKAKLELINGIIHPMVFEVYNSWLENHKDEHYTLHESAIVYENNLEKKYDFVINVSAPKDVRFERILQRDHSSPTQLEARMSNQLDEEEKNSRADFVIYNDGKQLIIPQILEIDRQLRLK